MKLKSILFTALLLGSGAAQAQYELPSVQVRGVHPNSEAALSFACGEMQEPRPSDVESLLQINDRTQTQRLSLKLMGAVAEACTAGISPIVVERGKDGRSVTWHAADDAGVVVY